MQWLKSAHTEKEYSVLSATQCSLPSTTGVWHQFQISLLCK